MRKTIHVLRITFLQVVLGLFLVGSAQATNGKIFSTTISGTVMDETDQTLVGVNVLEKGTLNGTVTDRDGKFTLTVENEKSVLVFSYIGYTVQEVTAGNLTSLNIKLLPDVATLGEVVVVGYGTSKKSDIITSVASVKPENLNKNATLDIAEMMRGKAAGVYVTTTDAGPGGSSRITIRGVSSIRKDVNGNTVSNPLIIADGIAIGSINDINPADIESMDILKDAASQAIYGSRAGDGVIIITTKRGKGDKVSINYNGYYGTQTAKRNFDVYTGPEFAQLKREAERATNGNIYKPDASFFSANEMEAIAENRNIDWSKEVMQPATIQNHNISFNAGSEKTKVYFGANHQAMTGIVPTTDIQKTTIRFNLDQTLTKWLKVGLNNSFQWSTSSDPSVTGTNGVVRQVVTASPLGNIYNADGSYNVRPGGNQESFNPLLNLAETQNTITNRNDIINVFVDISPIKGFNNRINMSRRSWNYKGLNYSTKLSESGVASGFANGYIEYQENAEWTFENITSYHTNIQNHSLDFTLVESAIQSNYYQFRNTSSKIPNDILGIYGLTTAEIQTPEINGNQRRLLSGVGRIEYDYLSKYSASVSARIDGSSVFGANNKWATFSSVAAGWTLSKENFMTSIKPINFLKLRASYGSVGYQAIEPYQSQSLADQLDYISGLSTRVPGYAPGATLANPNLKWETSTSLNLGLNFELFESRITGSIEAYDKRTTDMLIKKKLPPIGYADQWDNIGEVQNKGVELNIEGVILQKNDLTVKAGAMFSVNRNKILHLYGDADGDGIEENDEGNNFFIGQPIEIYRQPKYAGVWQGKEVYGEDAEFNPVTGKWEVNGVQATVVIDESTGLPLIDPLLTSGAITKAPVPGTVKLEDKNKDGKIDKDDNYITSRYPKWIGSFNLNASYKGFDFSMDIYTVQGITKNNQFLYDYTVGGDLRGNRNGIKVDYWTPENPAQWYPQPNAGTSPAGFTNIGLEDGSFWRLQNITIGYKLPSALLSKIKFNNARVYVTGQNLITKTDFQAYSPDQDLTSYPMTRNFIFGLSFGL